MIADLVGGQILVIPLSSLEDSDIETLGRLELGTTKSKLAKPRTATTEDALYVVARIGAAAGEPPPRHSLARESDAINNIVNGAIKSTKPNSISKHHRS